jgi:ubiquinone biosynthesis protein UbiJ
MKQLPKAIRNQLISALRDGVDLCTRYWAEGLGVEMQTAAKQIEEGQFKGDTSELRDLMDLIDGYHDFLLGQGHKFLAKDIQNLQTTVADSLTGKEE